MGDNLFERLHKTADVDHRIAYESAAYEATVVRWMLARLTPEAKRIAGLLRYKFRTRTGVDALTLGEFNSTFTDFPILLGCSNLKGIDLPDGGRTALNYEVHMDGRSVEPERFKSFTRVPFVVAYERFRENWVGASEARPSGLVFPRKAMGIGGLVVHDEQTEKYWDRGLSWLYKYPDGRRVYVQPFLAVLKGIRDDGWKPTVPEWDDRP